MDQVNCNIAQVPIRLEHARAILDTQPSFPYTPVHKKKVVSTVSRACASWLKG